VGHDVPEVQGERVEQGSLLRPAVVDDLPVAHDRERPEHLQLHERSMAPRAPRVRQSAGR
jgi:hypothetical protein